MKRIVDFKTFELVGTKEGALELRKGLYGVYFVKLNDETVFRGSELDAEEYYLSRLHSQAPKIGALAFAI